MNIYSIIYVLPYILHVVITYYQINRIKYNGSLNKMPLNDIIHENCVDLSKYRHIDMLFIIFIFPYFQKNGFEAFIFFYKVLSIILFIRVISSTITELPSSDPDCYINYKSINTYTTGHCVDKIFSGHNSATLLLILVAYKFELLSFKSSIKFGIFQFIYSFFALICTKNHYSVDVFLSYIIVPLVFYLVNNEIKNI